MRSTVTVLGKSFLPMSVIALSSLVANAASAGSLDAYRWKARLLVVVAADANSPDLAEQRRLYRAAAAGNSERDLVLVEAVGDGPDAQALRTRFGVAPNAFAAILVGKDGGAKLTSAGPVAPERLFAEIDAMPMRRAEVARQER